MILPISSKHIKSSVNFEEHHIIQLDKVSIAENSFGLYLDMIISLWQILSVSQDQADTYKCFATNEYGQAVCTANLNVKLGKWVSSQSRL